MAVARVLFSSGSLEEAQAFLGEAAAKQAGELGRYRREAGPPAGKEEGRSRELRRIAESVPSATGRLNQLKLILRKGFESFGELTPEDLTRIARDAGFDESGEAIAKEIVEHGLAGRTSKGALVPLREGR